MGGISKSVPRTEARTDGDEVGSRCSRWSQDKCPSCDQCKERRARTCQACNIAARRADPTLVPRWRGGRYVDAYGYVGVRVSLSEARQYGLATNARSSTAGYVKEHRLVMARHLGRALRRDENVHHKNGDRADNRIENLEMWVTSQPSGKRPEDLVIWAREILERYG